MNTVGTLWLADHTWHLDVQPHVHMRAKRVFGRLKSEAKGVLRMKSSPEVCADLLWFSQRYPLAIDSSSRDLLEVNARRHHETIASIEDLLGGRARQTAHVGDRITLTKPARSYQALEAQMVLALGGLLVGDDVGLGKTITAIETVAHAIARPALIVCQPHLVKQWSEKFQEFAPDLSGHIIKRKHPYELPRMFGGTPDVLFASYFVLTSGWAKVLAQYANFIAFDEVQELRHTDTQRYAAAEELCQSIRFKMGLSATPIYNFGGEIWSILNLLRTDALGSKEEFFQEWCAGHRDKPKLAQPKAFGTWARDNHLIVRHRRRIKGVVPHPDEVATLVGDEMDPCTRITHTVESDRVALDGVKSQAVELARTILSTEALERSVKWSAAGDLDLMLRKATGIAKAPYVAAFVRLFLEQKIPVLLYGWHRRVYDIWQEALAEFKPLMYTGTEGRHAKDEAKRAFLAGESDLLIISLRSGTGLDGLQQRCNTVVFGELDWSPGVHEQDIGRVYRYGQDEKVMAYFLVSEDGSDPTMVELLGLKRDQKEGVMNPASEAFLEQVDETGGDRVRQLAAAYLKQVTGAPRRKKDVA